MTNTVIELPGKPAKEERPQKLPEIEQPTDDFEGGPSAEWEMHFGQATPIKC